MGKKATTACGFFDEYFAKGPNERQIKEWGKFYFRIAVARSRPPRHEDYEFTRDLGMAFLEPILFYRPIGNLLNTKVDGGCRLTLMFPERWMSVHEEYVFVQRLVENPTFKDYKVVIVEILTKSPILIGSFIRDDVRILNDEEVEKQLYQAKPA